MVPKTLNYFRQRTDMRKSWNEQEQTEKSSFAQPHLAIVLRNGSVWDISFPDDFKSGSKIMLIQLPKTRQPYFAFSTEGNLINFIRADFSKDIIQYHQDFFYMISLPYDN